MLYPGQDYPPNEVGGFSFGKIFSSASFIPAMIGLTSGLKAISAWGQGDAMVTAASRNKQAAEFQAQQLEINAGQARAASQRDAHFQQLQGEQLISAIRARAGAGATDPSVLNIIGQAMARQSYNLEAALYGGKDKARSMRMQAASKRYEADLAMADAKAGRKAYRLQAISSLASGAGSLYRYWPRDNDPSAGGSSASFGGSYGFGEELDPGEMWGG